MILDKAELTNFGPLRSLVWSGLGPLNLVIGPNGCGKTFLLKALYSGLRTLEEYKRGDEQRSAAEILVQKLYWTFQPEKIGDLVSKGATEPLRCALTLDGKAFSYSFGKDTAKQINSLENHVPPRGSNSVFLPAKEVLSLHQIILKTREDDKLFGFDDTYLDLAKALRQPTTKGNNYSEFATARGKLEELVAGRVKYEPQSMQWQFRQQKQSFPVGVVAEGIKKVAILDTLLGNRYLDLQSVVFMDEPEAALHPKALSSLLEIIAPLAQRGIQFFLASHSYFVIKKLFLLAQKLQLSIPVLSWNETEWEYANLLHELPDNAIIAESIRLYQEEVDLVLG